jgi:hypothetical protein
VADVKRFEVELHEYVTTRHGGILDSIRTTGNFDAEAMTAAVTSFKEQFTPSAVVAAEEG